MHVVRILSEMEYAYDSLLNFKNSKYEIICALTSQLLKIYSIW